ncbi:DUF423 domain-containing protein [Endozoicomonas sp. OPT23]|uniref:DUF423 domain-containing protein n=1 Tax=Endozoicomonas sp. OPT23 TaxID=2072845 RepID=UPI00129B3D26|nr:DUF423 domain-containing protein [Endozoicomonas sp. OPT23]MRI31589.1 DUF423 domain-containing protein [Endozoicomonas sp. OPT23]
MRAFLVTGALSGMLSVGLGAFGAHALKGQLSERMTAVWATSTDYQFYHSLVLILLAVLIHLFPNISKLRWSGRLFIAGLLLFSGSLYLMALTGITWLGAITPLGGVSFMLGWLLLALSAREIKTN